MDFVTVGKVVSTHGIKGEIRIISDFPYKDRVFVVGNTIQIGNKDYVINSYRVHKDYDMVTLEGFNNINDVLFLLKKKVFVSRNDLLLNENEYIIDDLIGFSVYVGNALKGAVSNIYLIDPKRRIMDVETTNGIVKVPFHKDFIKEVKNDEKKLILETVEGLFS